MVGLSLGFHCIAAHSPTTAFPMPQPPPPPPPNPHPPPSVLWGEAAATQHPLQPCNHSCDRELYAATATTAALDILVLLRSPPTTSHSRCSHPTACHSHLSTCQHIPCRHTTTLLMRRQDTHTKPITPTPRTPAPSTQIQPISAHTPSRPFADTPSRPSTHTPSRPNTHTCKMMVQLGYHNDDGAPPIGGWGLGGGGHCNESIVK
jgi:hypothetical protein